MAITANTLTRTDYINQRYTLIKLLEGDPVPAPYYIAGDATIGIGFNLAAYFDKFNQYKLQL